jgi:hypothetical protein
LKKICKRGNEKGFSNVEYVWAERKSAAGWFAQMEIMICPLQRVEREGGFKEQ